MKHSNLRRRCADHGGCGGRYMKNLQRKRGGKQYAIPSENRGDGVHPFSVAEKADGVPHLTMTYEFSGARAMSSSATPTSSNKLSVSAEHGMIKRSQILHRSSTKSRCFWSSHCHRVTKQGQPLRNFQVSLSQGNSLGAAR